jgi:hypothetical protein
MRLAPGLSKTVIYSSDGFWHMTPPCMLYYAGRCHVSCFLSRERFLQLLEALALDFPAAIS